LTGTPVPAAGYLSGLSGRLLLLTAAFVMIAEVLIFAPSVANMRLQWLRDRLNTAAAASVVIEGLPDQELPRSVQQEALMATGAKAIVLKKADASRMVAALDMPPSIDAQYDLSDVSCRRRSTTPSTRCSSAASASSASMARSARRARASSFCSTSRSCAAPCSPMRAMSSSSR